nr:IS110 family transposase [Bacillus sp. MUM 116]
MKGITQTLTSVKGIGDVYAAGLIAEIGDIKRFKDHHGLAKYIFMLIFLLANLFLFHSLTSLNLHK